MREEANNDVEEAREEEARRKETKRTIATFNP